MHSVLGAWIIIVVAKILAPFLGFNIPVCSTEPLDCTTGDGHGRVSGIQLEFDGLKTQRHVGAVDKVMAPYFIWERAVENHSPGGSTA